MQVAHLSQRALLMSLYAYRYKMTLLWEEKATLFLKSHDHATYMIYTHNASPCTPNTPSL